MKVVTTAAMQNTLTRTANTTLQGSTSRFSDVNIQRSANAGISLPTALPIPAVTQESRVLSNPDQPNVAYEPCSFHNIEKTINIGYPTKITRMKTLEQIRQFVLKDKQPCLFGGAHIFGGSPCSSWGWSSTCRFHWNMQAQDLVRCTGYNSISEPNVKFDHYEVVVDTLIPNRTLIPIAPVVDADTTVYDLVFGFMFASNRGLEKTKRNEGIAMAYSLYYMINTNCRYDWLLRSAYWADSMTNHLMATIVYNEKILRTGVAPLQQSYFYDNGIQYASKLPKYFNKSLVVRKIRVDKDMSKPPVMSGQIIDSTRLATTLPPLRTVDRDGVADGGGASTVDPDSSRGNATVYSTIPYYKLSVFNAPYVMSLRASTVVTEKSQYAGPPAIGMVELQFNDGKVKCFAVQGPIMYGVSNVRNSRNLPFTGDMLVCTQASVATLAATSNVEAQEDRIFTHSVAQQTQFLVHDETRKVRLPVNVADAARAEISSDATAANT